MDVAAVDEVDATRRGIALEEYVLIADLVLDGDLQHGGTELLGVRAGGDAGLSLEHPHAMHHLVEGRMPGVQRAAQVVRLLERRREICWQRGADGVRPRIKSFQRIGQTLYGLVDAAAHRALRRVDGFVNRFVERAARALQQMVLDTIDLRLRDLLGLFGAARQAELASPRGDRGIHHRGRAGVERRQPRLLPVRIVSWIELAALGHPHQGSRRRFDQQIALA